MTRLRYSIEEHRFEIICLALAVLFIVLVLGLLMMTALSWRPQIDIEYGQRRSYAISRGSRDVTFNSALHYRDYSTDTAGSRRTSLADNIKELKDGLTRNITQPRQAGDVGLWSMNFGNPLRRLSAELPSSFSFRRKSSPGVMRHPREPRDLEEGSMVTGMDDAQDEFRRRSTKVSPMNVVQAET
jgi:hypothetical protein